MNDRPGSRKDPSLRPFIRSMAIELLIYAPIVMIYLLVVLRYGSEALLRLYLESPIAYTVVGIVAILRVKLGPVPILIGVPDPAPHHCVVIEYPAVIGPTPVVG